MHKQAQADRMQIEIWSASLSVKLWVKDSWHLLHAGTEAAADSDEQDDALDEMAGAGYTAAYAKLANASLPERPVLAEIADPRQFAESSLASFMSKMGRSA